MGVIKMYLGLAALVVALTAGLISARAFRVAHNDAIWAAEEAGRYAVTVAGPRAEANAANRGVAAAQSYLASVGVQGSVTVISPREVQITTHVSRQHMGFTVSATETHTAKLLIGVEEGQ